MSNARFAGSIPSMVSMNEADQQDDQLSSLMEDYARATQLQISLRKRITVLMKEREIAAEVQEEAARMQLEEAQSKNREMMESNELLRMKMKQLELMGEPVRDNGLTKEISDDHMGRGSRCHSPVERLGRSPTRSLCSRSHSRGFVGVIDIGDLRSRSPPSRPGSARVYPRYHSPPPPSRSPSPTLVMMHNPPTASGINTGSSRYFPRFPNQNPGVLPSQVSIYSIPIH